MTGHSVTRVEREGGDGAVTASLDDGRVFVADELLVAVGRRPATGDLGLEAVGLEPGRYITADDRLRAAGVEGEWLYAIGDCNGRALLTHMGKYQARIASDVILGKDATARADDGIVPRVTFTDPQVCAVGLTAAQAIEQGYDVRVVELPDWRCLRRFHSRRRRAGHESARCRRPATHDSGRNVHRSRSAGAPALRHSRDSR